MMRFAAGVVSALLLVTAGFFLWRGQAEQESLIPPAPAPTMLASPLRANAVEQPPAAPEQSREERRFARYDKDEDGRITRPEMLEMRRKAWARLDTDANGSLSFDEWAVKTIDKFAETDKDRSGALDAEEFRATKRQTKARKRCAC